MTIYSKIFKAIKEKCLDCSGFSANNVKECPCNDCPLYPYRLGEEPELGLKFKETVKCKTAKDVRSYDIPGLSDASKQ